MVDISNIFKNKHDRAYDLQSIDFDRVKKEHERASRRICFSRYNHGPQKTPHKKCYGTLSWPFSKGVQEMLPFALFNNKFKPGHVWRSIDTEEEFSEIKEWCDERKDYVYLYDSLSLSAALGFNKATNDTPEHTEVGKLVSLSKTREDSAAIENLISRSKSFLELHPSFQNVDYIMAMPAPHKTYDLPREIVKDLAKRIGKEDITSYFIFNNEKKTTKDIKNDDPGWLEKKWKILDDLDISYSGPELKGKKILLIDDNYQSGTSVQFIGMKLQEQGARQVFCLCMTKTLRDKGN